MTKAKLPRVQHLARKFFSRLGSVNFVAEHRMTEMMQAGNYLDAVRGILQEFFAEAGFASTGPPTVVPRDQPAVEARLNERLRELWHVAPGPPQALSAARFHYLLQMLRLLRRELSGRQLHLTP